MFGFLDEFRQVTYDNAFFVALIRLAVATVCGGIIGLERGRKRRPAGFRTHMLVCLGATLAMVLGQYLAMMNGPWNLLIQGVTVNTDVARLGAQVINGIGFLGAGTIIVTGQQEVKGLTTAAGLWASACMGLAIGAGFEEGALLCCVLISVVITLFSHIEAVIVSHTRNINLYVEFLHVDDVGKIISVIKSQDIRIFDVEIQKNKGVAVNQGAVFSVRLPHRMSHAKVMTLIASVENVRSIQEL